MKLDLGCYCNKYFTYSWETKLAKLEIPSERISPYLPKKPLCIMHEFCLGRKILQTILNFPLLRSLYPSIRWKIIQARIWAKSMICTYQLEKRITFLLAVHNHCNNKYKWHIPDTLKHIYKKLSVLWINSFGSTFT